jgi:hypothetical protein
MSREEHKLHTETLQNTVINFGHAPNLTFLVVGDLKAVSKRPTRKYLTSIRKKEYIVNICLFNSVQNNVSQGKREKLLTFPHKSPRKFMHLCGISERIHWSTEFWGLPTEPLGDGTFPTFWIL